MKLLLDTHVLLWAAGGLPRLPAKAKDLIEDEKGVRHLVALGYYGGARQR